ncbi:MAG: class I SAM-dependent methyltransferase [Pseudomonadota bacterium]
MSFSADWLSLRSDADRAARDADLAADLAELVDGRESLRVLDLGSGTGANLAATSPFLTSEQTWVLVDADTALLDKVTTEEGVTVERKVFDLSGNLGALFDPAPELVTASAFFDLCGAAWIDRLCDLCAEAGALVYAVLSYDGREDWSQPDPSDANVLAAFHKDQKRDKGLGVSLGPDAAAHLADALRQRGYDIRTARSDWELTSADDAELIGALAEGSAAATRPALGDVADAWLAARRQAEAVMIGHLDVLAIPPNWTCP